MTNPVERERISRELCSSFGYVYQDGEWLGGIHEDEPVYPPLRDAMIESRCRVEELERVLKDIRDVTPEDGGCLCEHDDESCCAIVDIHCPTCLAALALREKEPKV